MNNKDYAFTVGEVNDQGLSMVYVETESEGEVPMGYLTDEGRYELHFHTEMSDGVTYGQIYSFDSTALRKLADALDTHSG